MNLRNVLKVYGLQRQFNDDESALLKTLQSLNDTERDLLVESLSPAQKKSSKKSAGKGGGGGGRSKRATELGDTIRSRTQQKVTAIDSDLDDVPCAFVVDGEECQAPKNDPVHDLTYSSSHPFVSPAQSAESQSTTGSSETGKAAAGSVAQRASGGD